MCIDEAIKDEVTYANLIDMLKPNCKIILNEKYGFLVYHTSSDINVLLCDCKDGFEEKLLEKILEKNLPLMQIFNNKLSEMLKKHNYETTGGLCFQAVYKGEKIDSSDLVNLKKEDL